MDESAGVSERLGAEPVAVVSGKVAEGVMAGVIGGKFSGGFWGDEVAAGRAPACKVSWTAVGM